MSLYLFDTSGKIHKAVYLIERRSVSGLQKTHWLYFGKYTPIGFTHAQTLANHITKVIIPEDYFYKTRFG